MDQSVLERIASNAISIQDVDVVEGLKAFVAAEATVADIVELTDAIVRSGISIEPPQKDQIYTDIPSTGGPSSLTTLVSPIVLALSGANVLKISERGNPAGGIDILQTLPGFESSLAPEKIRELCSKTNYVHAAQGQSFAPADAKLIAIRRKYEMMKCPDLAIASLLAKKLCVGVKRFVVDLRVGPSGNVGDYDSALAMAKKFVRTGNEYGCAVRCILTDIRSQPVSTYIGRGEALQGLFSYLDLSNTERHFDTVLVTVAEALSLCEYANSEEELKNLLARAFLNEPVERLCTLLGFQGIERSALEDRISEIGHFTEIPIRAESSGYVASIDLGGVKRVLSNLYSVLKPENEFAVWEVGFRWKLWLGKVSKGDEICVLRVKRDFAHVIRSFVSMAQFALNRCLIVSESPVASASLSQVLVVVDENGDERPPIISGALTGQIRDIVFHTTVRTVRVGNDASESEKQALIKQAADIKKRLDTRARPFIVEFSGMPRAGKSGCIEQVFNFLTKKGKFRVNKLEEGAKIAPELLTKDLVVYNLWTMCYSLTKIVENALTGAALKEPYHFVLLDRGLLDAICWFSYLENERLISKEKRKIVSDFLRIEHWKTFIDLALVFTCSPDEAYRREQRLQMMETEGSKVTNPQKLPLLRETYLQNAKCYVTDFRHLVHIDTDKAVPQATGYAVVKEIFTAVSQTG